MGTARVVAYHAPDAATVAGGGFGTEEESVGLEVEVQFVTYHAWFDPYPPLLTVKIENMVKMTANVHHYAITDHLTGYAGASCPRDEMGVQAFCFMNELYDFLFIFGIGYA